MQTVCGQEVYKTSLEEFDKHALEGFFDKGKKVTLQLTTEEGQEVVNVKLQKEYLDYGRTRYIPVSDAIIKMEYDSKITTFNYKKQQTTVYINDKLAGTTVLQKGNLISTNYYGNGKAKYQEEASLKSDGHVYELWTRKGQVHKGEPKTIFGISKISDNLLIEQINEFHGNGNIWIKTTFPHEKGGAPVKKLFYTTDGELDSAQRFEKQGSYFKHVKNGTWYAYYLSGVMQWQRHFVDNIEEGPFIEYWPNGRVRRMGSKAAGRYSGIFTTYTFRGELLDSAQYLNGELYGVVKLLWSNRMPMSYGVEAGILVSQDSLGLLTVERVRKGLTFDKINGRGLSEKIERQGVFKNGYRDGEWKAFFEGGSKYYEAEYNEGLLVGKLRVYHKNAQLAYQASFESGEPVGWALEWYDNGQLKTRRKWINYAYSWSGIGYSSTGFKQEETVYNPKTKNGWEVEYNSKGEMQTKYLIIDGRRETALSYHQNSRQIKYQKEIDTLTGNVTTKEFNVKGTLIAVSENDKAHQQINATYYHESGKLSYKVVCSQPDADSCMYTYFYANGNVSQTFFKMKGKAPRPYAKYHENGKLKEKGIHKSGLRHGEVNYYTNDGKLKRSSSFMAGNELVENVEGDPCFCYDTTKAIKNYYGYYKLAHDPIDTLLKNLSTYLELSNNLDSVFFTYPSEHFGYGRNEEYGTKIVLHQDLSLDVNGIKINLSPCRHGANLKRIEVGVTRVAKQCLANDTLNALGYRDNDLSRFLFAYFFAEKHKNEKPYNLYQQCLRNGITQKRFSRWLKVNVSAESLEEAFFKALTEGETIEIHGFKRVNKNLVSFFRAFIEGAESEVLTTRIFSYPKVAYSHIPEKLVETAYEEYFHRFIVYDKIPEYVFGYMEVQLDAGHLAIEIPNHILKPIIQHSKDYRLLFLGDNRLRYNNVEDLVSLDLTDSFRAPVALLAGTDIKVHLYSYGVTSNKADGIFNANRLETSKKKPEAKDYIFGTYPFWQDGDDWNIYAFEADTSAFGKTLFSNFTGIWIKRGALEIERQLVPINRMYIHQNAHYILCTVFEDRGIDKETLLQNMSKAGFTLTQSKNTDNGDLLAFRKIF